MTLVGDVERMCRVEGLPGAEVVRPFEALCRLGIVALVRVARTGGDIAVVDGLRTAYLDHRPARGWRIRCLGDPLVQVLRARRRELEDLRADVAAVLGTS